MEPAATVVQPSAIWISVTPAGTRRRVSPEASYKQPFREEKAALPASTEMASTPAECEKHDGSTTSASLGMRAAPCLPSGTSKRRVNPASKSMPS